MRIDDLIPYERNARDHTKSLPALMESIRSFGFRGKIQVRSLEDPTIVNGHGRVAACKALGWTEIPDENIEFVGDLSDDDVRDYRLADNKVAELSTWKRTLLQHEVRASKVDMGRFGFDFKSKVKPYGAERSRTDDYYNLGLVDAGDCDSDGMPYLEPCDGKPGKLIPFNYAMTADDRDGWLHFFIDDYQFERLWNKPEKYLALMNGFAGVLSPDFSCYMDMPLPMQRWNEYRRRALANYWQRNGIDVIPTLSWADERSYGFSFGGLPKGSAYAVSTVGVMTDEAAKVAWFNGMAQAIEVLRPKRLIVYGRDIGFDFGSIEVCRFESNTAF